MWLVWLMMLIVGVALIVWGAERFAEHLGAAAARLGVSAFALALLLAGAEPEELATVIAAALRDAPGIAFGDIIGANITICFVALGVGAVVAPLPFRRRVFIYALAGVPVSVLAVVLMWDATLSRFEGGVLLALYVAYVAALWWFERAPPVLGETEVLHEAESALAGAPPIVPRGRVGRELAIALVGLVAMALGSALLVEAVRRATESERSQTLLGLTIVGFATAFELVLLCWSAARRGATDVVLAGVVGSYAYNVTMSIGAGAVIRPLAISDGRLLRVPMALMLGAMVLIMVLAAPRRQLTRASGFVLLALYPLLVLIMVR